jgi:hypothetical protein
LRLDERCELDIELPCEPLGKEPQLDPSLKGRRIDEVVADIADVL